MKKVLFVLSFLFLASTASFADSSVQFFRKSQATRVVNYLNQHPEVLLYCGCYPDYQSSYVFTYDVWMERYSFTYYEVWIYGYDVKTKQEIYTPLDLNCVWVEGANGYPANVAVALGFKHNSCAANFRWRIPVYTRPTRIAHPQHFKQNYFSQPNVKPRTTTPKYIGKGNTQTQPQHQSGSARPSNGTQSKPQNQTHTNNNGNNNRGTNNTHQPANNNQSQPATSNSRNSNSRR